MRDHNTMIRASIDYVTADTIAAMAYGLGMDYYSSHLEEVLLEHFGKQAMAELNDAIHSCKGFIGKRVCASDECPGYCYVESCLMESMKANLLAEQKLRPVLSDDVPF